MTKPIVMTVERYIALFKAAGLSPEQIVDDPPNALKAAVKVGPVILTEEDDCYPLMIVTEEEHDLFRELWPEIKSELESNED